MKALFALYGIMYFDDVYLWSCDVWSCVDYCENEKNEYECLHTLPIYLDLEYAHIYHVQLALIFPFLPIQP